MKTTTLLFLLLARICFAQEPITLSIVEYPNSAFPKLHSFAYARVGNFHIFIGGRTNGLHGFTSSMAFPQDGVNDSIFVLSNNFLIRWAASTQMLPTNIREAITTSNMQYYQDGNTLYMLGGYGFRSDTNKFVTFDKLTAIDVLSLKDAVVNGTPINNYFRQISDTRLKICGTHLQKIGNTYILPMGHSFDGTYSRNDTAGFFVQKYSNQIRRFNINDDGVNLSINNYTTETDTLQLHRRDYNLVPQINQDYSDGLTAFSGVFQYGLLKPYTNLVNIKANNFDVIPSFNQQLSHYHSAVMPMFDSASNVMHTFFFGGMAMYYYSPTSLTTVYDSAVPFVSTVSRITRDANNNYTEFLLPDSLPGLLGTNALFAPIIGTMANNKDIIDLNALPNSTTNLGYIVGGIVSPERNISTTDPSVSEASNRVFLVQINKGLNSLRKHDIGIEAPFNFAVSNVVTDKIIFNTIKGTNKLLTFEIFDAMGKKNNSINKAMTTVNDMLEIPINTNAKGFYTFKISGDNYAQFGKFIVK